MKKIYPYHLASDYVKGVVLVDDDTTASWEKWSDGKGTSTLEIVAHVDAKYLQVTATETGAKSTREVMATLDRDQALELKNFLNQIFS